MGFSTPRLLRRKGPPCPVRRLSAVSLELVLGLWHVRFLSPDEQFKLSSADVVVDWLRSLARRRRLGRTTRRRNRRGDRGHRAGVAGLAGRRARFVVIFRKAPLDDRIVRHRRANDAPTLRPTRHRRTTVESGAGRR
mmetsp:Transcript_5400/g.13870  ORF Transcript_5400/g.13870 Transcript_5400/m.13870 type:complete len:137 (+) Transcript_5400:451-861(+)